MDKIKDIGMELIKEIAPVVLRMQKKGEMKLSDQLKRSSASIMLNWCESKTAESKKMWKHKVNIALGEANETLMTIYIVRQYEYMTEKEYSSIQDKTDHLVAMLTKCVKTANS